MPIKFTCPHCSKALSVKDHLAGKRAPCPACKKVVVIPAPTAQAADLEALAAAAFSEDDPKATPEQTKFIEFECPQCMEKVKFTADMAGKRAPCPECRRIVKVPDLVRADPKDWRTVKAGPAAVLNAPSVPEPEGAWGSTTATSKASRQALEEAGVIVEEREKLTVKQWIVRVTAGVAGLAILVGVPWLLINSRAQNRQKQALAEALKAVEVEGKPAEAVAEIKRAIGEYYLRLKSKDGLDQAQKQFREARALLASSENARDRDLILLRLAVSQAELGGDKPEVDKQSRLAWPAAVKEIDQTLQAITTVEQPAKPAMPTGRVTAAREVCRTLLAKGLKEEAKGVALAAFPLQDDLRPELIALVAFDAAASDQAFAEELADLALESYQEPQEGEANRTVAPALLALCMKLNKRNPKLPELPPAVTAPDATWMGYAAGQAALGNFGEARSAVARVVQPFYRLYALSLIATVANSGDDRRQAVEAATAIIKNDLRGQAPFWVLHSLVQTSAKTGLADQAKDLASTAADPGSRGWLQLELFIRQLSGGKVDDSRADEVEKTSLAHLFAHEMLARHNARSDSGMLKTVESWDEAAKPFGLAGVALGLQD